MRTSSHMTVTGLPKYEAVPPPEARMLSQYMRQLGYYTTNNYKTDYQFTAPKNAWDESGIYAHWRNRPEGKPFYAVVNFTTTHESGLFEPYGFREIEARHYFSDDVARIAALPSHHGHKTLEEDTSIHIDEGFDFPIPPYLPDTDIVRRDLWKMYNNLAETDRQIGAVIEQLKADGLLENTIIFFYADHGGPLPRQKRLLYDSGIKVPLIIRFPHAKKAGTIDDRLVSFVDFLPTVVKLAGGETSQHLHGHNFLGDDVAVRDFIYAASGRLDGFTDSIRAIKNKKFKYIRNYRTGEGYYLPVEYREKIPTMQELLRLRDGGKLTEAQSQWFRETKDVDELFDTASDPHELNNLAQDPAYSETLESLKAAMDQWLRDIGDDPNQSESDLIQTLWQGQISQPKTAKPELRFENGLVSINSATPGATISFKVIQNSYEPEEWKIYASPIRISSGATLKVVAHRIGFLESQMEIFTHD